MIEFLDKMNNLQLAYVLDSCMNTNMDSSEIVGISVNKTNKYNEDLCDALWGAIKRDLET
jgi:hypothetical protein